MATDVLAEKPPLSAFWSFTICSLRNRLGRECRHRGIHRLHLPVRLRRECLVFVAGEKTTQLPQESGGPLRCPRRANSTDIDEIVSRTRVQQNAGTRRRAAKPLPCARTSTPSAKAKTSCQCSRFPNGRAPSARTQSQISHSPSLAPPSLAETRLASP